MHITIHIYINKNSKKMHIAIEVIPLSYSDILAFGENNGTSGITGICSDLERWAVQISLSALETSDTSASTVNTFSPNFLTSCIILSSSHKIFNTMLQMPRK